MKITLNGENAIIEDNGRTFIIDSDSITLKDRGKTTTFKGIEAAKRIADQRTCIDTLRAELRGTVEFNEQQAKERIELALRDHRIRIELALRDNRGLPHLVDDLVKIAREATHINTHDEDDEDDEWDDDE